MQTLKYYAIAVLGVFAPIKAVVATTAVLIMVDLCMGIWAASKRGEKVESAKLRRTVSKLFIFEITILSAFLLETYLLEGLLPLTKLIASVVGLVEGKSIIEHANELHGEPIFNKILDLIKSQNDKE